MEWRRVTLSVSLSSSCPAVTVTVCGAFQVVVEKASAVGSTVRSGLPPDTETPTPPVQPVGASLNTSVYVLRLAAPAPGSSFSDRLRRDTSTDGGVGVTGSVPVVRLLGPECAAASTVTATVDAALKP